MKLGDALKQARESKELTVQAVADAIHLSVKQINALETNNFNLLPEPVTTRGFIRSYARFLEIDSEPLLANYRELVPHQDPNTIVVTAPVNKVISAQEQSPWLMYILGSIIVLLLLVVWFYYIDNVNDWSVESDDAIVLESPVEPSEQTEVVQTVESAVPPVTQSGAGTDSEAPVAASAQTANEMVETAAPATETTLESQVSTLSEPLVLRLKEACWVSIKTMGGDKFFEKLLPAGTEQGFDIQPPFKLKIGNATAASASYRNQTLDLPTYTRGSVARLTVNDEMLSAAKVVPEPLNVPETTPAQADAAVTVDPAQALVIKTEEACWVSVKDAVGKKVFEQLLPPASNQVIEVSKPFKLTIGNASAAHASYNNQALDLASNKQHNVAKLKVE